MQKQHFLPLLVFSGILSLTALTGLGLVFIYLPPTIGPRWLFFFFLFVTVSAISLPVFLLINQRIEQGSKLNYTPAVRESLELAFFVNLIIWLKFGRVLDTVTAVLIFAVIVAIEFFLRLFERSRFNPIHEEGQTYEE
jgi:O-antigen/teichoic acid export membrane protein